ncbi:hypothetical protein SYN63AY4M2_04000 [Synechococcus sp. 63AY4M2]|jgi:hypothetical protein|nr:hypothetical protein SYN63AY4M2_04000 [Synechococcus sp. 63AY4M2]PIK89769.1 hypothetical protein SYN65AY6A5_07795 [Synechococcus sp. 65AY6A5]PIK93092.1 hypothetical protein SYN65AY6LI_01185 [Synechococcus sp. 65AY6Li]PIK96404.1 hypothetical protein SYN60AY4M2_04530 [Synechococcus sp. 60AY4M2]PIK98999.1 hypothetical protein SYN63AY4M1_02000 [Synechococcus sp. 63AY4M1]PIL02551.1 hypothetical protein SYN65AY640_12105 [Synechococcus sp. 65AY640]
MLVEMDLPLAAGQMMGFATWVTLRIPIPVAVFQPVLQEAIPNFRVSSWSLDQEGLCGAFR